MKPEAWQNLALAGLLMFYVLQIGLDVVWGNLCGHLGVDYCAFWSAGHIANTSGYADMYDLDRLATLEKSLFPKFGDPATFAVSPIAYLPVFMLPFQLLALLPLPASFWAWTLINLAVLIGYLRFFMRRAAGMPLHSRLMGMILLSLPVFWNILDGQVNVWLTVCVGEFMRAWFSGKHLTAGLWLGGLLLKPQNLVLIAIALLIQRSSRAVAGLASSTAALLLGSLAMVGMDGFNRMLKVWLGFAQGIPTNYVELMMNWRMLGVHVSKLVGPLGAWIMMGLGMLGTALLVLALWRRPIPAGAPFFFVAMLGTLAGTAALAWHSHIPTAMMLMPPLLLLEQRHGLPRHAFTSWIFGPVAAYVIALFFAAWMHAGGALSSVISTSGFLNFIRGFSEFVLNIYLLVWAVRWSLNPAAMEPARE